MKKFSKTPSAYTIFLVFIFFFSVLSPVAGKVDEKKVKFIQISDVHLHEKADNSGSRMYKHSQELFTDAVKQVNNIDDIDFVVFTGDMIGRPDKTLLEKFVEKAGEIKYPWFCTTGNHDIGIQGLNKKVFLDILRENRHFNVDKPYYALSKNNFVFLFMDGTNEKKNTANGFFPKKELSWLEEQLKLNRNSYIVIFQHYPVVEPFSSASHCVLNADEYLEILDKYENVIAVITGHYHVTKVTVRNKVAHISSPALVQYPNAFRVITLENTDEYVSISYDFKPTKQKNVRMKSLHLINSINLYAGKEKDQNGTIILHKPLKKIPNTDSCLK